MQPGSSRSGVGGCRGDALLVRVNAAPVDGKATEAALRALARALGILRRDVRLVSGATSQDKVVEISDGSPGLPEKLDRLRAH